MLFGREELTAGLDSLLITAQDGQSHALVLLGEPGIGKTALLNHSVDRAMKRGFEVL